MSNQNVGAIYAQIITDVIDSSRVDFEEMGVEESVLEDLKKVSVPSGFPQSIQLFSLFSAHALHHFQPCAAPKSPSVAISDQVVSVFVKLACFCLSLNPRRCCHCRGRFSRRCGCLVISREGGKAATFGGGRPVLYGSFKSFPSPLPARHPHMPAVSLAALTRDPHVRCHVPKRALPLA